MKAHHPSLPANVIMADAVPTRQKPSLYPPEFAVRVEGRTKRQLGDHFGLKNFGVNLTHMAPGSMSALRHCHSVQDEFIYVLAGEVVLVQDEGETLLTAGMCAGFAANTGNGHHLINRSPNEAVILEVGDRSPGDSVVYPDDDLQAVQDENGQWRFLHKNGDPY